MGYLNNKEYADLVRKCATIVSKSKEKLEIMDITTFRTIKADIDKDLFNEAEINDHVTYIEASDGAKVLEIRKQ